MKIYGWFSDSSETIQRIAGTMAIAMLAVTTGIACAQSAATDAPASTPMSIPLGYSIHESVDVGGRMANINGSGAMYDTMVNLQSGPRVQGETFLLRALPGTKNTPLDEMQVFARGFGGDPVDFAKMDFSKGKYYEFSSTFRRDRRYFDYDLLDNPGVPTGYSIPIGPAAAPTGHLPWPQVNVSPFMFNTVRRMTDTSLTLFPVSKATFRFAYSQNLMQGPSRSPSGNSVGGQEPVLMEYQRNNTDDFTAALDWKPVNGTKLTYEEQIDHYKGDTFFTALPQSFNVQESDGTPVALLTSYQTFVPYGYNTTTGLFTAATCSSSIAVANQALYANPTGGLPIIDPSCNVMSSYIRQQPTRVLFPTEIFRLQSTSIKNISMNGNARYTNATMNMPYYSETFNGLDGADRQFTATASANAKREVMAADFGIIWDATRTVSIEDQINFSNAKQPGSAVYIGGTTTTVPTTKGDETINWTGLTTTAATSGAAPDMPSEGGPTIGVPMAGYLGQRFVTNNFTVSWNATPRTTFSLTYRYQNHLIAEGQGTAPHNVPLPPNNTTSGELTINTNGGIFTAALRPATNWDINGSIEAMYNDNAFTPMGFRQLRHYRVHTIYRPRTWATVSGAFNDMESHNNTNDNTALPGNTEVNYGPLDHVAYSRVGSFGLQLFPNDHYGLDLDYSYSDVYMADNACFQAAPTVNMPGGTIVPAAATQAGVTCGPTTGGSRPAILILGKDFEDAPTQFMSAAVNLSPDPKFHSNIGYRVSSVNGSRLFTDAGDVNGALVSNYQTPFVNVAWTSRPGLIWKGEYDYYNYGEGGRSGAQYCNANPALAVGTTVVPTVLCSSVANTAMSPGTPLYGFTAPRNFHALNLTLGVHYEF